MFLFIALVLGIPLGTLLSIVAGSEGAAAGSRLPARRHLIAAAVGALMGCGALAGSALAGFWAMASIQDALTGGGKLIGCLLVIAAATVTGILTAYLAARLAVARLDRFECRGCGACFRSSKASALCPTCTFQADQLAAERAAAEFQNRYGELSGRPPREGNT